MTLRGYEVLEGMAEHVHAHIIERTLIVWVRQAKELSLIGTTSANENRAEQTRSATYTSGSDMGMQYQRKVSGHKAGRLWKGHLKSLISLP